MAESGQDATERAVRYSDVAVLIPCYNEELTVGLVVEGFQRFLPGCRIYVADNASKDRTAEVARAAGATVLYEPHKGKGYAVRRLFADVDAECYILVDGDATYDPTIAHRLVEGVLEGGIDMVTTVRVTDRDSGSAY